MTSYVAPLPEITFVLREIAGLAEIRTLPGGEDASDDLVGAVLEEAGRFASGVLAPLNAAGDRQGCTLENGVVRVPDGFAEAWQRFVAAGWNGLASPTAYGGQALPGIIATAVSEIWSAANMAFALCPLLTQAAAELLERHGNAEMRAIYLPRLVSGEWTGTMLLTEPQAGSDLSRVRSRAVRDGDRYRITGQKIYITFGEHDMAANIVHAVLARTPDAPAGVKGLSLFLVPKFLPTGDGLPGPRNDVRCVSIEHKLGINGSPTAVMAFGDGDGAIGYLIGAENRGLEIMFTMMNKARLAVGLEGVGIADRAYQQARAYAAERVQGRPLGQRRNGDDDGVPVAIVHHPDVQRMLLTMKSRTEGARALAYFTAGALDRAHRDPDAAVRAEHQRMVDLLTPVVKGWCTETGIEVANTAIQVHGGMGYIEESGVPQFLRDARIAAIYEGTNGIQALDLVGRKVAADGGAAVRALMHAMRATADGMASGDQPDLLRISRRLQNACDQLAAATDWLVATYPSDPRRVAAGAVYYLRLLGNVCGGWLMAISAQKALERAAAGEGDAAFCGAKLKSASYFTDTRLAEAGALHDCFIAAGDALHDLDPLADL